MAVPRPAVNSATHSVGFTAKLVTVQSISTDGKSAVCVDRQHTQVTVPMLVQPSKGLLPAVGETWLVTQALGQWTFTAIVASSVSQFQQLSNGSGVFVSNVAPASPASGDLWINPSMDNLMSYWNGTNWVGLQMGAVAIQPGSLTHVQLSSEAQIAASQVNFKASDIGGVTVSITATQPTDPSAGDLWYDAQNGYVLKQWTGVNWAPYQWGTQAIAARAVTAELIAANTITAAQLAAGLVYAGIIDGTIVQGTYILGSVFEGTNWIENAYGAFFYSGTPAAGNLIASITPASGANDGLGNAFLGGVTAYYTTPGFVTYALNMSAGGGYTPLTWLVNSGSGFTPVANIASVSATGLNIDTSASGTLTLNAGTNQIILDSPVSATGGSAASPTVITTDSWNTMTLLNGWTVGSGGIARYMLNSDGTVTVQCTNLTPGTLTSGTAIWNIPANYRTTQTVTQNFAAIVVATATWTTSPFVAVRGTGTNTLTVQSMPTGTSVLSFTIRYSLS